jgi:Ca-activated chloride channel family protein
MNTPRNPVINPDDPKWTAYILGELDEEESAQIEHLLETSEEARALVEELTMATESMKEELTSLLPLIMTPEQRAAIRKAAKPPKRWFEVFPSRWGLGLAAAALLVIAVAVPLTFRENKIETADSATVRETKEKEAAPVLPQITIVRNEPATSSTKPGPKAVAPVLTPEQVTTLVQGVPTVAAPPSPLPAVAPAPAAMASLTGTVEDPSKALIPGVTVTATNASTGAANTVVTNESGAYSLSGLLPGSYNVTASIPGFQTQTVTNLSMAPNDQARVNYTLQVAGVATKVEVTVSADQIFSNQAASVGVVQSAQRAADLPINGNNVLDRITVMPGVSAPAAQPVATPPPPPVALAEKAQQGQQGQQGGGGGGGGRGGGGARGAAAAPTVRNAESSFSDIRADNVNTVRDGISTQDLRKSTSTINPDLVGEIRIVNAPFAAPPPPPPPPPAAAPAVDRVSAPRPNTEAYDRVVDNPFIRATQENLATFSIDVDTASYANVRRFLTQSQLPPADAVRIEELVNYFSYDYAQPTGNAPIAPNMEVAAAPWNPANRLVRIGIKAREVNANRRPPSNLVFLIDVSGSMSSPEKLPLVKAGLNMLVERLGENDSVSIVVYAGNSGLVLAPTSGNRKETIRQAIDSLQPGGSTNGASGIQLAYNQAIGNFQRGGVNRVILMTDGDFNVGATNQGDLTRLIEDRAKSGVFLSVLGFGMGNYKDSTLEKLADQGNGNYAYIDNLAEARKVLVEEMSGTLITVAKDVKMQVDFNPARVEAYRLIGYENRVLRTEDFNNDAKDAGDMGAGHTVTALFEVVPKGGQIPGPSVDPSKYTQAPAAGRAVASNANASNEMLTLRVRYKLPDADNSTRMDVPLVDRGGAFDRATGDFRFAASVAEFGMILRNSPYKGTARMDSVLDIAEGAVGTDRNGYRKEFITLVQRARNLGR